MNDGSEALDEVSVCVGVVRKTWFPPCLDGIVIDG